MAVTPLCCSVFASVLSHTLNKSLRKEKSGLKNSFQHDGSIGEIGGESVIHCYKYIIIFLNKNNFSITPASPSVDGSSSDWLLTNGSALGNGPISSPSELQHWRRGKKPTTDSQNSSQTGLLNYKY